MNTIVELMTEGCRGTVPDLTGVPQTMLWALYGRASEARRPDAVLHDPDAVRIADSIVYDYARSFGRPDLGFVVRALGFNQVLGEWLKRHPDGQVIALGEGLDTQFQRVDNGRVRWLSIDLPEAIEIRSRFIPDTERHRNLAFSALDYRWIEQVDRSRPSFVTAPGVLMYFLPADVRTLIFTIAERIPNVEMMFDATPHWISRKTLRGLNITRHYQAPPMPWGLNRNEAGMIKAWHPAIAEVRQVPFPKVRGMLYGKRGLYHLFLHIPWLQNRGPSLLHLRCNSNHRKS